MEIHNNHRSMQFHSFSMYECLCAVCCVHVHEKYEVHAIIYITRFSNVFVGIEAYLIVCFRSFFFHWAFRGPNTRVLGLSQSRPFSVLNFVCLRAFIALCCILFRACIAFPMQTTATTTATTKTTNKNTFIGCAWDAALNHIPNTSSMEKNAL